MAISMKLQGCEFPPAWHVSCFKSIIAKADDVTSANACPVTRCRILGLRQKNCGQRTLPKLSPLAKSVL